MPKWLFAIAVVLSCSSTAAWTQVRSSAETPAAQATINNRTPGDASRPSGSAGACQLGVIPIAGNLFAVQRIRFPAFLSEYARIKTEGWDLEDLVVARVRAAARGLTVQRIPYTIEELTRNRPSDTLFRNADDELKNFARAISAGKNCKRYVVVHRFSSPINDSNEQAFGIGSSTFGH